MTAEPPWGLPTAQPGGFEGFSLIVERIRSPASF